MIDHKTGYTLMEIIIVLLMISILAGIAISHLFKNVEYSRSLEALESIGSTKRAIEMCAMALNNDFSGCVDYPALGMTDPSYSALTNAGAHFAYTFTAAANSFQIVATRNTLDSGTAGDTVIMERGTNAAITRSGTTAFSGVQ